MTTKWSQIKEQKSDPWNEDRYEIVAGPLRLASLLDADNSIGFRPTMEIRTQGDHTFTHLTPSDGQFWLMGDEHWLDTRTHRRLVRSPNLKAAANHSASPRRARTSSRSRTCRGRSWASGARRHVCAPRTPGIRGKCDHYTGFTIYLLFLEFEFPAISFKVIRNVLKFVGINDREWRYRMFIVVCLKYRGWRKEWFWKWKYG